MGRYGRIELIEIILVQCIYYIFNILLNIRVEYRHISILINI